MIYTIFVNVLRWSVGFSIMKPDNKEKLNINAMISLNYSSKINEDSKICEYTRDLDDISEKNNKNRIYPNLGNV